MHVRPSSWYSWPPLLLDYPIPQHPDRLNLQLDDVTGAQVAIHLQAAPAADRPRSEKIAGMDGLPTRHMRDHLGERPVNGAEPSLRPDFAIHPRDHSERVEVGDLIRGDKAGPDGRGEVLPLGWPQAAGHLLELDVPRAEVVHDRVASDVGRRLLFGDIPAGAPDDAGQLQLVVQLGRLQRPREIFLRSDNRPVIALVIDRRLVPFGRNGLAALLGRGGDVLLEGDEVAQRRRIRERGQETDLLRTIEDRFTLGALRGLAERDRVLERLTSPG